MPVRSPDPACWARTARAASAFPKPCRSCYTATYVCNTGRIAHPAAAERAAPGAPEPGGFAALGQQKVGARRCGALRETTLNTESLSAGCVSRHASNVLKVRRKVSSCCPLTTELTVSFTPAAETHSSPLRCGARACRGRGRQPLSTYGRFPLGVAPSPGDQPRPETGSPVKFSRGIMVWLANVASGQCARAGCSEVRK